MKLSKLVLFSVFLALFFSMVSGTQIEKEDVEIDLGSPSQVSANLSYEELTQRKISYIVPYQVYEAQAIIEGSMEACETNNVEIGTEILCDTSKKENFNAVIKYKTNDLVNPTGEISEFSYSRNILEPVDVYELKVILPEGSGIYEPDRDGFETISPEDYSIGSTGRRIHVKWIQNDVDLGSTLRFNLYFERLRFFEHLQYLELAIIIGAGIVVISLGYLYFNSGSEKKTISSVFPVLKEGEKEVLKVVIENGKECKQKKIVSSLDYSKAKISRIIKDLNERNLISKEKVGRTNIIRLNRELGDVDI